MGPVAQLPYQTHNISTLTRHPYHAILEQCVCVSPIGVLTCLSSAQIAHLACNYGGQLLSSVTHHRHDNCKSRLLNDSRGQELLCQCLV